jgi:CHAT domain-containing protein
MTLIEALQRAAAMQQDYMAAPAPGKIAQLVAAIETYEAALDVLVEPSSAELRAGVQNNLANAYAELPTGDRGAHLQRAIGHYEAALRVYTETAFPTDWAMTQNNLANAYARLPTGDRGAHLQRAIGHYEAALRVRTETAFPTDWAATQNNLANAYAELPTGDRGAHLQRAIGHYEAALRVYTPDRLPYECLGAQRNLANLHFAANQWHEAFRGYSRAAAVVELVRADALQASDRRRVLRESAAIFERAVVTALRTGQYPAALTMAERGKTRSLADHVWSREVRPRQVAEADWREYQKQLVQVTALEREVSTSARLETAEPSGRARGAAVTGRRALDELGQQRQAIAATEAKFRDADPDYVPLAPPLTMSAIGSLSRTTGAVLTQFRVTDEGTYVFLVGPGDTDVTAGQVVHVPLFNRDALRRFLLSAEDDGSSTGWLINYYRFRQRDLALRDWLAYVERATGDLYDRLIAPVHGRLRDLYPEARRLMLVPNQGLGWLPLHACAWTDARGARRCLVDEYDVSYTPSCQVLARCHVREQGHGGCARSLFAVQNPDGTLAFSDWEVEEIAALFDAADRRVLAGAAATEADVKRGMAFGEEKLFSCHGAFDPADVPQSRLELHAQGRLMVPDVMAMDLRGTWLVVKSACETGLTDPGDLADEYEGLPAAFLMAGAATVVPSLWAVNDFSTALLMQRFHLNLYGTSNGDSSDRLPRRPMAKTPALCEAQRWLRDLTAAEVHDLLDGKRHALLQAGATDRQLSALDAAVAHFHLADLVAPPDARPFANPHWWAAFQCIGAGWETGRC